jgi:hypothetical protein
MEGPPFNFDQVHHLSHRIDSVFLGFFRSACSAETAYACRWFTSVWDAVLGKEALCQGEFCMAMVPTTQLPDPHLGEVDCSMIHVHDKQGAQSSTSQWQQDWFVYQNFFRGTEADHSSAGGTRQGIYVDVGAFHPIKLSNTVFFERCLGWKGACVEPNPSMGPYFRAFRPNGQLLQHCVWSKPRKVVMSFSKDPIEAFIEDDIIIQNGSVWQQGGPSSFQAECKTLAQLLTEAGLNHVDYMSVDAESAEVEIFKVFPFNEFDISVISIEVQPHNYYTLDLIMHSAGYVKVGVLGGDHVYSKLASPLVLPPGAAFDHGGEHSNFYEHAGPKTVALQ